MTVEFRRNWKKIILKYFPKTDILQYQFLMALSANNIERTVISEFPYYNECDTLEKAKLSDERLCKMADL